MAHEMADHDSPSRRSAADRVRMWRRHERRRRWAWFQRMLRQMGLDAA